MCGIEISLVASWGGRYIVHGSPRAILSGAPLYRNAVKLVRTVSEAFWLAAYLVSQPPWPEAGELRPREED